MITAIIFDADGVLIHREKYFSERSGLPLKTVTAFMKGIFQECLIGRADLKEELKKVVKEWEWKGTVDELLDFWFEGEKQMDEKMFQYARQLRKKGIKVFLATNNEKYRVEYLIKELKLNDLFDKVYASAHIGQMKPDVEFFQHILKEQKLQPNQVLFWDDDEENITGAKKAGLHAELFTNISEFEKKMKEYLSI